MKKIFSAIPVYMALLATLLSVDSCKKSDNDDVPAETSLEIFAVGLVKPIGIENAGDDRLFVVEQNGTISIIDSDGNVNPVKFLDISDRVTTRGSEQGLLGLAFHPDYANNGWFYVNYIGQADSTYISRFSVQTGNPNQADPSSEVRLLSLEQPFGNHNGGSITFGPDGYLYMGLGDGGSGGDPGDRAQNLEVLLGKILRIDVNSGAPYAIPATNPFYNDPSAKKEIWAYGLRNPWRISFDRLTGDLWIADVGQNMFEEINMQPAASPGGENYGWRCYEGNDSFNLQNCSSTTDFVFPVHTYSHGDDECSVTGGYVYRGNQSSPWYGRYFFADFCSDRIWTLRNEGDSWVEDLLGRFTGNGFSSFGQDSDGELYIAGLSSGTIYKFRL